MYQFILQNTESKDFDLKSLEKVICDIEVVGVGDIVTYNKNNKVATGKVIEYSGKTTIINSKHTI